MRELLSLLAIILVAGVVIGDRHHFDHHGRHHEDKPWKHHGKAPCPYPHKDVKVSLRELGTPKNETIVVDVSRKRSDENSVKSSLKIHLRIHVIQGSVHVNGHKIDHAVVTSIHLRTQLAEIFADGRISSKPALVQVRIMVVEVVQPNGIKMLSVQEEIVEVDNEEVSQIEVKEVVLELGDNVNESKRTVTAIKISESKIHHKERGADKHYWACKGPFAVTKREKRKWKHMHPKRPSFELGRNDDKDEGDHDDDDDDDDDDGDDDDDDDDDDDKHHHKKHHGKHHRHHHHGKFKRLGEKFCKWFHGLPLASRAALGISVVLIFVLLTAACCTCCCKKSKKPANKEKYMDDAISVNEYEAEPLPEKKKQLDEMQLIA